MIGLLGADFYKKDSSERSEILKRKKSEKKTELASEDLLKDRLERAVLKIAKKDLKI